MGGLVASATAGVLLGFGLRSGDALLRFNLTAAPILGGRAGYARGFDPAVTPIGLLVHIGWAFVTGIAFAAAFPRVRGARAWGAAAAIGVALLLLQRTVFPWIGGSGSAAPLSFAQSVLFGAGVTAALALGIRIAKSGTNAQESGS